MAEYSTLDFSTSGQVATIQVLPHDRAMARAAAGKRGNRHEELADLFEDLRRDNTVRVVIVTGAGDHFAIPTTERRYTSSERVAQDPTKQFWGFTSIVRCHQAMAEMEKPIIAKVNGHAVGFGQSLAFACDLIVAREDAVFMDHHMGGKMTVVEDGEEKEIGHGFSSVPGDGGAALLPLLMSPHRAKEYLMLAQQYTARDLERLGIINYAVPADELDKKVDDLVAQLLKRAAFPLAWTKRLVNRRVADQLNRVLDAGVGYEMLGFLHREKLGGQDKLTLE